MASSLCTSLQQATAAPQQQALRRAAKGCCCAVRQGTTRPAKRRGSSIVPHATFNPFAAAWSNSPDGQEPPRMRSIFQPAYLPPLDNSPTVHDARDALETCRGLDGEAKTACFAVFNCEPKHVEQYYEVVSLLEHALEMETDPEEEARHHGQERC